MEGIGGEISSKIRAAIKTKLMEMGAYVDEELPDYVMVMVANKRSKAQMTDDLQLFLGKSTEQFTNWLQQVLNKLQEVATVNNKALTDAKKLQSRALSSDEAAHKAKSASKLKCEQVTKPRPENVAERAAGHRSDKKHTAGDGRDRRVGSSGGGASAGKTERAAGMKAPETATSKTKIILMNSDAEEEDDEEDFINIKADAEAEALLKAELPASAKQLLAAAATATAGAARPPAGTAAAAGPAATVAAPGVTAALAHSTSGAQKARPAARRVVTAPASKVAVAPKRSSSGEGGGSPAKKAAPNPPRKSLASTVAIADRLGVRASAAPSIKDRLGTRAASTAPPVVYSRLAGRLGARNPTATAADGPAAEAAASVDSRALPARARVADRLGTRREEAAARKRLAEGARGAGAEVTAKRPAAEGGGGSSSDGQLTQRLRKLAEGPGARVAHVPPNNIRQGAMDRRPSIISQVVPAGVRGGEGEESPSVALPSVVRVTPRPRLPARLQANKNLLLKAMAEAQRSVAAAAASAPGSGAQPMAARWRGRSRQAVEAPPQEEEEEAGEREEEEQQGEEESGEETTQATGAGHFTLGLLTRENFAVTVPNESGATGDLDVAEAEERSDNMVGRVRISRGLRESGKRRLVVTAPSEAQTVAAAADVPQQITIRLSPDNSCDGDSSSDREEEEAAEVPPLSAAVKDNERRYAGRSASEEQYEEEEDEEEGPAAAVAAVRPTVVTTVPHMDTEPVTRTNPQFVVTLDGVDVSSFPNGGADDEECPVDSGRATDRDLSKADSGGGGAGQSAAAGAPATGKATVVQRVEPRLRLGPMPTAAQRRQEAAAEAALAGVSSGSGSAPGKAERCKYWPACRLGAKCAFHHPTQTCRAFPACKFGEKCLYIHPNCKFDAACTRRDCPYTHSSPRLSAAAAARGPAQPGSAAAAVCRFFPGCTNPACRFLHPKACKYGRYCVKTGCTFQHDEVPTTDKLKWVCPFKA